MIEKTCTECNQRTAMHSVSLKGVTRYLCCECNIAEGGVPADWHPDCMLAYELKMQLVK